MDCGIKMHILSMEILKEGEDETFLIQIKRKATSSLLTFSPHNKELIFLQNNKLTEFLKENEYQLRKLFHNKKRATFYTGFKLTFAMRDKKDVAAFNDKNKTIVLNKQNSNYTCTTVDYGKEKIYKIYTDASYLGKQEKGAYAFLIENHQGEYSLHTGKTDIKNSNLLELYAVIQALKTLKTEKELRIISDSQYVKKGITEWIFNWKLNGWHTVNGEKVKHIKYWQELDSLTENKYLEFCWVKGHSNHFENTLCDLYAKETAAK